MAMIDVQLPRRAPGRPKREKAMLLTACEDCGWEFETTNPHHRLCPTCRPAPCKRQKPIRDCGAMPQEQWAGLVVKAQGNEDYWRKVRPMANDDYGSTNLVPVNKTNGFLD